MQNFSVRTMVDVECNLLNLGQRATPQFHVVNNVWMWGLNMLLGGGDIMLEKLDMAQDEVLFDVGWAVL